MASDQSSASADAARIQGNLGFQAYETAMPALKQQYGFLNQAIGQGGEPDYVARAYDTQRVGLEEGIARQGLAGERSQLAQGKAAQMGGNALAGLTPQTMGSRIAEALSGSRVNEGLGRIEQLNKLVQMGLGQTAQAGSGSIAAGQAQLQGIAGLPQYNSTYANVLTGVNLLGSAYGGYQQLLANQQPGLVPGAVLPTSTNYSSFGG